MTRRRSSTAFLYMLLLATVIGAGCSDGPNQPATPENSAPTIVSCDAEPSPVAAGEATTSPTPGAPTTASSPTAPTPRA